MTLTDCHAPLYDDRGPKEQHCIDSATPGLPAARIPTPILTP